MVEIGLGKTVRPGSSGIAEVLSSFNPLVLRRLKRRDPEVRTALIFMDTNWNPELLAEIRPEDRGDLPWFLRQEWIRRGLRKLVQPDLLSINHEVDERVTDRPYGVISDQQLRDRRIRDP